MYKIDSKNLLINLKNLNKRMNDYQDPSPDTTWNRVLSIMPDVILELERMYKTNTEQVKEEVRAKLLECIDKLDE